MSAPLIELQPANIRLLGPVAIAAELHRQTVAARNTIAATVYMITLTLAHRHPLIRALYSAMLEAPARSVLCTMIVPDLLRHTPTPYLNARACEQLLAAGWNIRHPSDSNLLHAKTWLFDHRVAIIGSHNLTEQALIANHDISILIESPAFAERLYRQHNSIPITRAHADQLRAHARA